MTNDIEVVMRLREMSEGKPLGAYVRKDLDDAEVFAFATRCVQCVSHMQHLIYYTTELGKDPVWTEGYVKALLQEALGK